jgi:Spy/CpxP family protein refolding chaperone
MSNRLHQLILALAASGLAAGAWAQAAPPGLPPDGSGGPPHAWHDGDQGEHRAHKQWGGEDSRDGEWGGHRHHHHHRHHCHHHHHHHGGFGHGWGEDGWGGGREHRGAMGLMGVYRGLNLTDAQQQQIHTILTNARQQAMKEHEAMKDKKPAPDMAALANPGDPNYRAAVEAAKKRAADRIQHMSDLKLQIYNVLTAEQKSELTKRIAAWKTRMAQREDGAKGPPPPAGR